MNLDDCIHQVEFKLKRAGLFYGHGTDNAFNEAFGLVMSALGFSSITGTNRYDVGDTQQAAIDILVNKRIETRQPLAYLTKVTQFAGHEFFIDSRAMIPRSHLSNCITERFKPWAKNEITKILDLGTGSGCLAVSMALTFPDAHIDATDISSKALEVAKINVRQYGVGSQVRLLEGDLFDPVSPGLYDLIVCNPPYMSNAFIKGGLLPKEYEHEPKVSFDGGKDGLEIIRRVLRDAHDYLNDSGVLFMEVISAAEKMKKIWPDIPFTWIHDSALFTLTSEELRLSQIDKE